MQIMEEEPSRFRGFVIGLGFPIVVTNFGKLGKTELLSEYQGLTVTPEQLVDFILCFFFLD